MTEFARIIPCPPSPETSRTYFESYCPTCATHEGLYPNEDNLHLVALRDAHNTRLHGVVVTVTAADLLNEYGSALRLSWNDIDGRGERDKLAVLAAAIREHGNAPLDPDTVTRLRWDLDVCPRGLGHWTDFCDDDCAAD